MTEHLTPAILNALADGELFAEQIAQANEHLAGCPSCTRNALHQLLLKSATVKAGRRYELPPDAQQRLTRLAAGQKVPSEKPESAARSASSARSTVRFGLLGWATAAVLLLAFAATMLVQRHSRRTDFALVENAALVTEIFDQHVATLAGSLPPQVVSTDRHTVKPWFQGRIPFSFNLPEDLPKDTTLNGANLTYLRNQPVAQLLYSIGRHRVSVFVREKPSGTAVSEFNAKDSGFYVIVRSTENLEMAAVSDVDPARLAELVDAIRRTQIEDASQRR
jgi:anti-sigma factor RsiW